MKALILVSLVSVGLVAAGGCKKDPSTSPLSADEIRNEKNHFLKELETASPGDRSRYLREHQSEIIQMAKSKDFSALSRLGRVLKN